MSKPTPALASLSLSMLLSALGTSVASMALPALAHAFHAPFQNVQWVVLAYLLAVTTLIVGVGRLGDLMGRRWLLLAGIALFTAASMACGVAPTLWWLVAARAVQGIGAAIMMALTMALVGDTVPTPHVGKALGLLGTMSAVGTALGPALGGVLIATLGWRSIFLVNVPLGLLAGLLTHRHLASDRRWRPTRRPGADVAGTVLLALALAAYALAMTMGRGRSGSLNGVLLLSALVGLGLFLLVETWAASPMIDLAVFRDPTLSASLAMGALVSTVMMATLVIGPFYLSRTLGLDAARVGFASSVGPLVAALTGVPAGRLTDRLGASRVTIAGLAAMVVGALLLAALPGASGLAGYLAGIVVTTAGYALFQTANNTAVMAGVEPSGRGVMSGLLNLSRNLGLVTGASLMGAVFAHAVAPADLTTASAEAVSAGLRMTFAVAAWLIVAALGLAVASASRAHSTGLASAHSAPTS